MFPIVRIVWEDAHSIDPWTSVADIAKIEPTIATSVGYLVRDDNLVALSGTALNDDISHCCVILIPKSCVISREVLHAPVRSSDPNGSGES